MNGKFYGFNEIIYFCSINIHKYICIHTYIYAVYIYIHSACYIDALCCTLHRLFFIFLYDAYIVVTKYTTLYEFLVSICPIATVVERNTKFSDTLCKPLHTFSHHHSLSSHLGVYRATEKERERQ